MRIKVEFEVDLPDLGGTTKVSHNDITNWLKYNLGALGGISFDNPLHDGEIEAVSSSVYWQQS